MEALLTVFSLLALALFYLAYKYYHYRLEDRLFEHVSWCVGGNSIEDRRDLALLDYIHNAQVKHHLSKEYCIIEESERTTAKEILRYFQEYLTQAYFKGNLSFSRKNVNMDSEAYFFDFLKYYLEKNECETYFHENELYDFLAVERYTRYYKLTEYGIVYHKLLYTVRLWYLDFFKDKIQQDSVAHRKSEYSKKVLDTNEIEF